MDISLVAPELRTSVRRMPRLPFGSTLGRGLIRTLLRLTPVAKVDGVTIETIKVGNVPLRIYRPAQRRSNAALYWIHGGGFIIGNAVIDDRLCGEVAKVLGIVVVSVDYRLAPEHPFPAPLQDCLDGWRWMQLPESKLGIDPQRIAIGGQSAGGALAACLIQQVHDEGPGKAAAQWLFCPMLDDRTAARRDLDSVRHRLWSNRDNAVGWRAYLAQEPGAPALPPYAAASRRDDLAGLPPAWIGVGDIDLFHDEDSDYAGRLRRTGIDVEFVVVPGAPHGFESWAPNAALSRTFVTDAQAWLGKALGVS